MNKLFSSNRVEARKSPIHGWGIFAKTKISKGDILEQSHGLFLSRKSYEGSGEKALYCNCFAFPRDTAHAEVMIPFGLACVYNTTSPEKCNADWYFNESERIIIIYTTKDIEKDEEIFINYYEEMMNWEKKNLKI